MTGVERRRRRTRPAGGRRQQPSPQDLADRNATFALTSGVHDPDGDQPAGQPGTAGYGVAGNDTADAARTADAAGVADGASEIDGATGTSGAAGATPQTGPVAGTVATPRTGATPVVDADGPGRAGAGVPGAPGQVDAPETPARAEVPGAWVGAAGRPGPRDQGPRRPDQGRREAGRDQGRRGTGRGEPGRDQANPGAADGERDEVPTERSLRGLVGGGSSQVSVIAALRARDAARPTEADLAAAEAELTIVRRGWVPREELPRPTRGRPA